MSRGEKVIKICLVCSKKFIVYKRREFSAKYCSKACHNKSLEGNVPWNKGLTKETNDKVAMVANKNTGRIVSPITKLRSSKSHKGKVPWNKGRKMDEQYRNNVIIGTRKAAKDPNDKRHSLAWRKRVSESNKKKIAEGCRVGAKKCSYVLKSGEKVTLRSKTELNFILLLESLNVKFEYEKLRIKYIGDDKALHLWIPDFYLQSYNLLIDTKYGDYYKDYELINKIVAAKNEGYRVLIIDYEIYNGNPEPSLVKKLIEEGVETIPRGSRVLNYLKPEALDSLYIKDEEIVHTL